MSKLPAANGKFAVGGFCWGGSQTFRYATNNPNLKAAFVFYGSGPESKEDLAKIKAPVEGFYAGNDARINATLPKTIEMTKELGKKYWISGYRYNWNANHLGRMAYALRRGDAVKNWQI